MKDKWEKLAAAAIPACTGSEFVNLAKLALAAYTSAPEKGEAIAGQMTGIWILHGDHWQNATAEQLGQLFADLEIPPRHVVGGEQGARRKWREIARLCTT